jgi:hypothetical protein
LKTFTSVCTIAIAYIVLNREQLFCHSILPYVSVMLVGISFALYRKGTVTLGTHTIIETLCSTVHAATRVGSATCSAVLVVKRNQDQYKRLPRPSQLAIVCLRLSHVVDFYTLSLSSVFK